MTVLLKAVLGSTAYGLARQGSDTDYLGVFVAPTLEIAGLHWHSSKESVVTKDPDTSMHEVGKFITLALKANPTITELLWVSTEQLVERNADGNLLRELAPCMLSTKAVANAYLGYATSQATRLENRTDGTFSSDTRHRTVKHARHMLRLLRQGRQLLETGKLSVRVANPEEYWAFDDYTTEQILAVYEEEATLTRYAEKHSVLPEKPNVAAMDEFMKIIRRSYLT